jgi:hypothetical protein
MHGWQQPLLVPQSVQWCRLGPPLGLTQGHRCLCLHCAECDVNQRHTFICCCCGHPWVGECGMEQTLTLTVIQLTNTHLLCVGQ